MILVTGATGKTAPSSSNCWHRATFLSARWSARRTGRRRLPRPQGWNSSSATSTTRHRSNALCVGSSGLSCCTTRRSGPKNSSAACGDGRPHRAEAHRQAVAVRSRRSLTSPLPALPRSGRAGDHRVGDGLHLHPPQPVYAGAARLLAVGQGGGAGFSRRRETPRSAWWMSATTRPSPRQR